MPGDTKNCDNCGENRNPNPIDSCGRESLGCNNPCGHSAKNSARCESLPSQIENFTTQFFGTVVKTEINGVVTWSLPCQLDVGLPGNPRGVDEGLACYFLRLFRDGLGGLKGDPGVPGASGQRGTNAFTVVTQGFNQPTPQNPLVQFLVDPNPAIVAGMGVFIAGSGYYLVTAVLPGGIVFATFQVAAPNLVSYVQPGSLVIPTGANAVGAKGATGQKGDQGAPGLTGVQGAPGSNITAQNGYVYATGASAPYSLATAYGSLNFGGLLLEFNAPESGTYLVTATIPVTTTIQTAQTGNAPELVYAKFKLKNTTTSVDIAGSETFTAFVFTHTAQVQSQQVTVNAVCHAGIGETLAIAGIAVAPQVGDVGGLAWATINAGTLSWVRIA
jgi:hypothetical protein